MLEEDASSVSVGFEPVAHLRIDDRAARLRGCEPTWRFAFQHLAAHHDPVEAGLGVRRHAKRVALGRRQILRLRNPAARVFGHAAPRPGFQGLHERGLNDVLDEVEPAHAERPGQHGDEPAELVAKKVLYPRAWFAHA